MSKGKGWAALGLTAVVAVVGGLIVGMFLNRPTDGVGAASPTPTAEATVISTGSMLPTTEPTGGPAMWTATGSFGEPGRTLFVSTLAVWENQLIAAGTRYYSADPSNPSRHEPVLWLSDDGGEWQSISPLGLQAGAILRNIVPLLSGELLAIGFIDDLESGTQTGLSAWQSRDAQNWTDVQTGINPEFFLAASAAGAKGIAIIGTRYSEEGRTQDIWTSVNGHEWTNSLTIPDADADPATFVDIGAGQDGFVVTGRTGADQGQSLIFASGDGVDWFEATDEFALDGASPKTSVVAIGGDWLLAAQTSRGLEILRSSDGLSWEELSSVPIGDDETIGELVATGHEIIVASQIGCCGAFEAPGSQWASPDGSVWAPLDLGSDAYVRSGAEFSGAEVLAGNVGQEEAPAAMWLKRP